MNSLPVLLGVVAIAGTLAVALRHAYKRARTVPELMASVDTRLATDLCLYAGDLDVQIAKDERLWKRLGGVTGLLHLVAQARLWLDIVIEIRKDDPTMFAKEARELKAKVTALTFAAFLCIFEAAAKGFRPVLPRINARVCVDLFAEITSIAEMAILQFDSTRAYGVS